MDHPEYSDVQRSLLSDVERAYLRGENVDNVKNRRDNIEGARLPNLADRLQRLVDDIALLEQGGYLAEDGDHSLDVELLEIDPRLDSRDDDVYEERLPNHWGLGQYDAREFGLSVGLTARSIQSAVDEDVDDYTLVWGFLLGLFHEGSDLDEDTLERIRNRLRGIISGVDSLIESSSEDSLTVEKLSDHLMSMDQSTRDYSDVRRQLIDRDLSALARGRVDMVSEENIGGAGLERHLEVSKKDAARLFNLRLRIPRVKSQLDDKSYKKVEARYVFDQVWKRDNTVGREDFDKDIMEMKKGERKRIESKLENDLAGEKSSEEWDTRPLLERDSNSCRLTPFGKLLGYSESRKMRECIARNIAAKALGEPATDEEMMTLLEAYLDNWGEVEGEHFWYRWIDA